jgi:hypothetical protein
MIKKNSYIVLSLGLILIGCIEGISPEKLRQLELELEIKQIQYELVALKLEMTCSADTQCVPLGVGAKPCGGPIGYLPLSIMSPNKEAAETKALRHMALSKELLASDVPSDCSIAPAPTLACAESKCVVTSPNYVPPF